MRISLTLWMMLIAMAFGVAGCAVPKTHNLPPAQQLMEPGPGVGGPGPGVLQPGMPPMMIPMPMPTVQVLFNKPENMQVRWDVGGQGQFDSEPLVTPARYNFPQAAIYRLKLTDIEGRDGVELYPTLEVGPTTPRTMAYLEHNAIPVQFTNEDLDQVLTGNFVTKVIYLPDAEYAELAIAGVETLVSTRLDPGVDPIVEADRRGSIMAVIRIGNKQLEMADGDGAIFNGGMGGFDPSGMQCGPGGMGGGLAMTLPPNHVAGVTAPAYGMPMSGTPIGLPGPPHIPLGGPAGLRKHVMKNHTHIHMPDPTHKVRIDVKQQPGMSYPKPANHMYVREQTMHAAPLFHQPHGIKHQDLPSTDPAYCPPQ